MTRPGCGSRWLGGVRARLDRRIDAQIEDFYREVPFGAHQRDAAPLHLAYYKRHNVETILRLRLKRTIDALTIRYFTKCDPPLAKTWAEYTADEMLHDRLFARDLKAVGVAPREIYAQEPFLSTKLLQGYFYYGLEHEGVPLASLTSSYFIEYATLRTQPAWLGRLARELGAAAVRGARAHVEHDRKDGHIEVVWKVLAHFIRSDDDAARVFRHCDSVYSLFCMYFRELYEATVAPALEVDHESTKARAPEHGESRGLARESRIPA